MKVNIQTKPDKTQEALLSEFYLTDYYKKAFYPYFMESKQLLLAQQAVFATENERIKIQGKIELLNQIHDELASNNKKLQRKNPEIVN